MDDIIETANHFKLVDYMLDIADKELIEKYKSQLDLYKRALEKALKRKVDKAFIYSTSLNECIKVDK